MTIEFAEPKYVKRPAIWIGLWFINITIRWRKQFIKITKQSKDDAQHFGIALGKNIYYEITDN